jgi:hypothetical protein
MDLLRNHHTRRMNPDAFVCAFNRMAIQSIFIGNLWPESVRRYRIYL